MAFPVNDGSIVHECQGEEVKGGIPDWWWTLLSILFTKDRSEKSRGEFVERLGTLQCLLTPFVVNGLQVRSHGQIEYDRGRYHFPLLDKVGRESMTGDEWDAVGKDEVWTFTVP
jgi:hypothetical protein